MVDIYSKFSICDSNIIIDFSIINKFIDFLEREKKIFIADFVLEELKRNFIQNSEYRYIIENIEKNEKVIFINKNLFTSIDLAIINRQVNSIIREQDCFVNNAYYQKNIGEVVSCFYAINLGIKKFITNDLTFIREYENEPVFNNLTFENRDKALGRIIFPKDFWGVRKEIEVKNNEMKKCLEQELVNKSLTSEELIERFNSYREASGIIINS